LTQRPLPSFKDPELVAALQTNEGPVSDMAAREMQAVHERMMDADH
jgi:hypothetical protein